MSAPTAEKQRRGSVEELSGSESASESPLPPRRQQQRTRRSRQRSGKGSGLAGGNLPLDNLPVSDVTNVAQGAVGGVTNALGGVANTAVEQKGDDGGGKSDTLRLRLDLNLDIEITLKARIHGDLELALLN